MNRIIGRMALILCAGCLALPACKEQPKVTGTGQIADSGLGELKLVYEYCRDKKEPVPRRMDDLDQYVDTLQKAYSKVQSGEYIIVWGVGMDGSNAVLAYEKTAATTGGQVLLRDGMIKQVSGEEFRNLRK